MPNQVQNIQPGKLFHEQKFELIQGPLPEPEILKMQVRIFQNE
jgi:hypothetical protein